MCKDCWWMPNNQFSLFGRCLRCWWKKKKAVPIGTVLWEQTQYFNDMIWVLWDNLWNVIRTVGEEGVLFKNKYATVWTISGAFRWVKWGVGRGRINSRYFGAYNSQISWYPIPLEVARNMVMELYDPGCKTRVPRNRPSKYEKKIDTRIEEKKIIAQLFSFICNYRRCVEAMEEGTRTDKHMNTLQELSSKWDISPDMIRLIREDDNRKYGEIKNIIRFCRENKYPNKIENRRTKRKVIFNLPSELTCGDSQREELRADST